MKCAFCKKHSTKVLDSRVINQGFSVRRRRECENCKRRFTTYEKVELSLPIVVKNDGRREAYNREKIFSGMEKASQKRPVTTQQLERAIETIERDIQEKHHKEVSTKEIGKKVMLHLRNLDAVAYVRFASVYSHFQDIEEFVRKLQDQEKKHFRFFHPGL